MIRQSNGGTLKRSRLWHFALVVILLQPVIAMALEGSQKQLTNGQKNNEAPNPAIDEHMGLSGRELMDLVYSRHQQFPYVYEEQSMILIDRQGHKQTRKLRRYSRLDNDGTARFLLLFDSPSDVEGVAMLASRSTDGTTQQFFFLPAHGSALIQSEISETRGSAGESFLGSDYSIENLTGEVLNDYQHLRQADAVIDETPYYVIDVFLPDKNPGKREPVRRHYVLKRNLYIARTDHFDNLGRLRKRQTHHDLQQVNGEMWRANMMLMEDKREQHRTVIKIDRRVFSADYVLPEFFTRAWIIDNAGGPMAPPEPKTTPDEPSPS